MDEDELKQSFARNRRLYQSSDWVTCGCPIAAGDGHDFPRLIDERVPSVAAVIDDIVEGFENSVRQPVLSHELPDIFLAVELGRAWRELQERDVARNLEGLGAMPAGLIEEENSVSAPSDFGCDLIEVKLHSFGVASRQHEGGAGSAVGADRTEQIGRLGPLIVGGTGARAFHGPAVGQLVLLTHPHLILEPDFYRCVGCELRTDFRHTLGEVFLNASMASAFRL